MTPTRSADAVVLGVPTIDDRTQAVLEASLPAHRAFREIDLELLTAAAHLGGLVLEASRAQVGTSARAPARSAGADDRVQRRHGGAA